MKILKQVQTKAFPLRMLDKLGLFSLEKRWFRTDLTASFHEVSVRADREAGETLHLSLL